MASGGDTDMNAEEESTKKKEKKIRKGKETKLDRNKAGGDTDMNAEEECEKKISAENAFKNALAALLVWNGCFHRGPQL